MTDAKCCENCGAAPLKPFVVRPTQTLWHCQQCDLYQKGTLPHDAAYEDDYHEQYQRHQRRKLGTAAIRLSTLAPYVKAPKPRLLDIGCSIGAIVETADRLGWHGVGVDVSHTAVERCRHRGLDCHYFDGETLPFEDQSFDVVTSWHVIEHVLNVAETLRDWFRVLKPGGVMVLETPDAGYLKARIRGPRYHKFWAPEHIYTFRRHNLRPFLEQAGFEMLRNPVIGKPSLLPGYLAGYSLLYRGVHAARRSLSLSKAFVVYCRRPQAWREAAA